MVFGRFGVNFDGLKRSQILNPKLKTEKVVPKSRGGGRGVGQAALILVFAKSIIVIIDPWALES